MTRSNSLRYERCVLGIICGCPHWRDLGKVLNSSALEAVPFQVSQERVKPLVLGQNRAMDFWRSFQYAAKVTGNVEVQGVVSYRVDLLELDERATFSD